MDNNNTNLSNGSLASQVPSLEQAAKRSHKAFQHVSIGSWRVVVSPKLLSRGIHLTPHLLARGETPPNYSIGDPQLLDRGPPTTRSGTPTNCQSQLLSRENPSDSQLLSREKPSDSQLVSREKPDSQLVSREPNYSVEIYSYGNIH